MNNIKLWQGDCLALMKNIPDGSVDLVLPAPPYGTVKGMPIDGWRRKEDCAEWDLIIDTEAMFSNAYIRGKNFGRQKAKLLYL